MSWRQRFVDHIPTKGKPIVTLQDAAQFILKLPKAEQSKPHWQAAAEAVIMAAEDRGLLMHADVGMKRALNAGKPVEFDPKRKRHTGENASSRGTHENDLGLNHHGYKRRRREAAL